MKVPDKSKKKFAAGKFLQTVMRLNISQKTMITILITSKSPISHKFNVINCENNSYNMFYILNELAFNGESSQDEVRQRV